jgi:hypothetical protein
MSSLSSTDIVRYLVLPILIGLIGGILSAFVSYIKERADARQQNRTMQVNKAIEICTKIIEAMDILYSHMRSDVWDIASRKKMAKQKMKGNAVLPQDLIDLDQEKWKTYLNCLDGWRHHEITYETELKAYFGKDGYEAFLFADIDNKIEQACDMVWDLYYGPEGSSTTPVNYKTFKAGKKMAPADLNHAMAASQLHYMKMEYFDIVAEMREQIATLSSTMISCIQAQNVGNLKASTVPVPDEAAHAHQMKVAGANKSPEATLLVNNKYADDPEEEV